VAAIAPVITDWTWPAKLISFIPSSLLRSQSWKVAEYVNPNVLGGLMVLMLPLAVGLWMAGVADFSSAPRVTRSATAAAILAISGMLALSQARGGYIGAAAAFLLFAYLLGGKWRWAVAGGLYATLAGVLWVGAGNLKELFAGSSLVNSWEVRAELWSRALYMIQDFSFTGVGLGMYSKVANVLYPFFLISPDTDVGHAHNLLLQVAVDLGIPGLVAYCILLAHAISRPLPALPDYPLERTLRIGAHCALVAMLVHGLLDSAHWSNKLAIAPWFVIGLLETAPASAAKPWLRRWEIVVWWVLLSLLAISFVGDHPYWALAVAIAGGAALGTLASRHP
jgi:putative inorganic carbon (HCO3(-)) transporter